MQATLNPDLSPKPEEAAAAFASEAVQPVEAEAHVPGGCFFVVAKAFRPRHLSLRVSCPNM